MPKSVNIGLFSKYKILYVDEKSSSEEYINSDIQY